MTIYVIQANCEGKWLDCYRFNNKTDAVNHKNYMDSEYPRKHRIIEKRK